MESAMLRYFSSKAGLCSLKLASDCGRPASTMATLRPASERRFAAQPPEAPEPTTRTSKFVGESGVGICGAARSSGIETQDSTKWMLTSGAEVVKGKK